MAHRGCRHWLGSAPGGRPRQSERDLVREANTTRLRSKLEHRFEVGGLEEAVMRALVYIRLPEGSVDERGFAALRLIRASRPVTKRISCARFKEIVREQYLLVSLDEERAINAMPALLDHNATARKEACEILQQVLAARGALSDEARSRQARIEAMFAIKPKGRSRRTRPMPDLADRPKGITHDKYDAAVGHGVEFSFGCSLPPTRFHHRAREKAALAAPGWRNTIASLGHSRPHSPPAIPDRQR